MPRKEKQYIQAPIEGGAIPTQLLVEGRKAYGGAICAICKHHLELIDSDVDSDDEMEGKGILKEVNPIVKKARKASKKVGKYVTDPTGLASDVVNYGLPAATSALLAAPATAIGGPAAGVLASAVGAKVGTLAADKIANSTQLENRTGQGIKRKARFEKGSDEAKEWARKMREAREAKKNK